MTKKTPQKSQKPAQKKALTRDQLRAQLLGANQRSASKLITIYGVEIELRQPTLKAIMEARDEDNNAARAAGMIIEYAFVPGTDEHIFEDTDRDIILNWPYGEDLTALNIAIADLTGVDISAALEGLQDPLGD